MGRKSLFNTQEMDRQVVLDEADKELTKLIGSKIIANDDIEGSFINPDVTVFDKNRFK